MGMFGIIGTLCAKAVPNTSTTYLFQEYVFSTTFSLYVPGWAWPDEGTVISVSIHK